VLTFLLGFKSVVREPEERRYFVLGVGEKVVAAGVRDGRLAYMVRSWWKSRVEVGGFEGIDIRRGKTR
jgi:hypothetical protein